MNKYSIISMLLLLCICQLAGHAQKCSHFHELAVPTETYHLVEVPREALGLRASTLFSETYFMPPDLRVFGRTAEGDTLEMPFVEVPYILTPYTQTPTLMRLLTQNPGKVGEDYRYLLTMPEVTTISKMVLNIKNENFDGRVVLEGANALDDWQVILSNARVLAFRQVKASLHYTALVFPPSTFKYYRITISGIDNPDFPSAFAEAASPPQLLQSYPATFSVVTDAAAKRSLVTIVLPEVAFVDHLIFHIRDTGPYARYVNIESVTDTLQDINGSYNFGTTLQSEGMLSHDAPGALDVPPTVTRHLQAIIRNGDDQPLTIDSVTVLGPRRFLKVRFLEAQKYWLAYGCEGLGGPEYDLARQQDQIPDSLTNLALGQLQLGEAAFARGDLNLSTIYLVLALIAVGMVILFLAIRLLRS